MKNAPKSKRPISAEAIARQADRGKDVSKHFTNQGRMVSPVLNVSRQAVSKPWCVRRSTNSTWRERLGKQADGNLSRWSLPGPRG